MGPHTIFLAALFAVVLLNGCQPPPQPNAPEAPTAPKPPSKARRSFGNPEFRKGVALGLFAFDENPSAQHLIYEFLLDEIAETGATDVLIAFTWHQHDVESTRIDPGGRTPEDPSLRYLIQHAKGRNLRVTLMPYIYLEARRDGVWRGTLAPRDRAAWWRSYRRFILHYAEIAGSGRVDGFVVGSELLSMERDVQNWRDLISAVRKQLPSAQLTYSANWDRFETVRFWDALDVIGISAYPPVGAAGQTAGDYSLGWRTFRSVLTDLRRRVPGKKVMFTEIGYPSVASAAARPWDHSSDDPVDIAQQTELYKAMFETWSRPTYIEGMFVWNWFGVGGASDRGYTPRGKPAAKVVAEWYGGTTGR